VDDVTRTLGKMSEAGEGGDDQSFTLTAVLTRVNQSRKKGSRVTRKQLEDVLLQLEVDNKLMYVRDGDDPVVMLI
jgi:hypothetical protein